MLQLQLPANKPRTSPFAVTDAYKLSHPDQYAKDVTWIYDNYTPRKSRVPGETKVVWFGLQSFLFQLNQKFQKDFFDLSEDVALEDFKRFYISFFGSWNENWEQRIRGLHQLGFLPFVASALPEGSIVDHGIPCATFQSTHPDFFWFVQWLETWLSCETWLTTTAASTAYYYKRNFDKFASLTSDETWFTKFQGHNFSMRGMEGVHGAIMADLGHRIWFWGTDTCPTGDFIDEYYLGVDAGELNGTSVPATEHAVMCAGSQDGEAETFKRLLTEVYPSGIVSVVSDTWDFWKVVTETLPSLKEIIMARDGKLVIRPDSSPKTPVEMIIGDPEAFEGTPENKGLAVCLWEIFGGTTNSKGFKVLDPHIGMIYGDSITLEYQEAILQGLMDLGFDTTQIVLGIGSFTYQYCTRDTHGIAIKATAVGKGWTKENNPAEVIEIFKDPKTDKSGKKSAKGLLAVIRGDDGYELVQGVSLKDEREGFFHEDGDLFIDELDRVYSNGVFLKLQSFSEIRRTAEKHATWIETGIYPEGESSPNNDTASV